MDDDELDDLDWVIFSDAQERAVLTGLLSFCSDGEHEACPSHAPSEEHGGQTVFCVCPCHQAPRQA